MNSYSFGSTMRRRHEMLRILQEESVRSQDELQRLLRHRGFPAAQPTLSRDLRELGVAKSPAGYVAPAAAPRTFAPAAPAPDAAPVAEGGLDRAVREFVLSAEAAGSLVVLHTPPADASPVARAIDEARLPEIAGTICGDDTIFLAARSAAAAGRLARRLQSLIAPDAKSRTASRSARPRRSKRS